MTTLRDLKFEAKTRLDRLAEIRDTDVRYITTEIRDEMQRLVTELEAINRDISAEKRAADIDATFASRSSGVPIAKMLPLDDPVGKRIDRISHDVPAVSQSRASGNPHEYRSLFGQPEKCESWRFSDMDFFSALLSGRAHPGLGEARAMAESSGSAGGYMVPVQESEAIFNIAMQSEIIMPKCTVIPMNAQTLEIPAFEIGNNSTSLYGGFTASFSPEAGTMTDNNPTTRKMTMVAKKMFGFCKISNELFSDIGRRSGELLSILGQGMGWFRDKFLINGSVAGPQGIVNSPAKITIAKEQAQVAGTILYENLANMLSRLNPGSIGKAVWLASPTCLPQLLKLSIPIGTGGSHIPVLTGTPGAYSCLLTPIVFTEHLPVVGSANDILLVDLSQTVVALRKEISVDTSQHIYFDSDQIAIRLISRFDSQSLWDKPMTLNDGVTTVSPCVALAARA